MQRAVAGVVQISKHCVRISPRILTTDPRPRLRADAVSDLLSVSEFAICFVQPAVKCQHRLRVSSTQTDYFLFFLSNFVDYNFITRMFVISERILTKYQTTLQVCYFFTECRSYISHCLSKCVMSFYLLNDY